MIDVPREDIVVMLEAGYIYLAMKRFKEARTLFEGICELAPKHDVPLVAVANVYFAMAKYIEAIRVLKNTIKYNPKSAFAHAHLGEALLFYGKRDDAKEILEKASQLEPDKSGQSGEFARSLIELINLGYDPLKYKKIFKEVVKEQREKAKTS
ncbi:MAG: tetratricopeptide repeat protein [Deltaproteobacteria bacterium]|nr:tetratricopeptide repeat protein [Deltaproteobacteria bacterium]